MKLNKLAVMVGALALSGSAMAELSANIGATSNYVWRGVTQTDNGAAISGGVDYAHDSGIYVGTWASNVDFGDNVTAEVDLYGGFANEVNGLGYDVGVIGYIYPGEKDTNFVEIYGSLSYGPVTGGINYTVDSQVKKSSDTVDTFISGDVYYYVSAGFEFMPTWTVGGTIGYYDFKESGKFDVDAGGKVDTSYAHYQLDIGKSAGDFGDFTFSLSTADKESGDSATLVFASWAKTF